MAVKRNTKVEAAMQLGGAALIAAAIIFLFSQFNPFANAAVLSENMSYGIVFLIGVLASVSTCVAVTGGLLVSLAAKYNEQAGNVPGRTRFRTHLYFNIGRIISYTVLGALIGAAGSALTLSPVAYGVVAIVASLVMFMLGLQMLGLMPGALRLRAPKAVDRWANSLVQRRSAVAAFALGALTFFLPCGFTQALQLYVLAKGDALTGALTMLTFSLGTLPVLLGLSAASSFASGNFKRYFFRIAGAAIIVLSVISVQSGLTLLNLWPDRLTVAGSSAPATAPIKDGKQIVQMKVVGLEYIPNRFTVVEGVPVEWRIEAQEAEGCGRVLVIPKLRISRLLSANATTIIAFTPDAAGEIIFNCGMGMMTPNSKFVVVRRSG
jgi:sulfite exporter TauE/SafE